MGCDMLMLRKERDLPYLLLVMLEEKRGRSCYELGKRVEIQ
jgi:hypothetical protein